MKAIYLVLLSVYTAAFASQQSPELKSQLVGSYLWIVPGSTWTLTLRSSGDYNLTVRGSLPRNIEEPIESGRWVLGECGVTLTSEKAPVRGTGGDYRMLYVMRDKRGRFALVSALLSIGEPGALPFKYAFLWSVNGRTLPLDAQPEKPYQTAEPASPSRAGSP